VKVSTEERLSPTSDVAETHALVRPECRAGGGELIPEAQRAEVDGRTEHRRYRPVSDASFLCHGVEVDHLTALIVADCIR
jgi:hypothetical protein